MKQSGKRQCVQFGIDEIWAAYEAGAKDAAQIALTYGSVPSDVIPKAADAYCKLVYEREGGDIYAPPVAACED